MKLILVATALVTVIGCSKESSSSVDGADVSIPYIYAADIPADLDQVRISCVFRSTLVEISVGSASGKSGPSTLTKVDLALEDSREMKRLVRDAFESEVTPSNGQIGNAGTCADLAIVSISDKKQGRLRSGAVAFSSSCNQFFAGTWMQGSASTKIVDLVRKYCPDGLKK
jgi:hypothetical protein